MKKARSEFETYLQNLASTGFARDSLEEILAAEISEKPSWAVGEAIAEAYLSREYKVTWPWNTERDKRHPNASLPGADLVGFIVEGEATRLVLGEVKSSTDIKTPPSVMSGRSGLIAPDRQLSKQPVLGLSNFSSGFYTVVKKRSMKHHSRQQLDYSLSRETGHLRALWGSDSGYAAQ